MIAVILLIAFLITGCEDKSVKTDHIIRIGVVTYTQDDPFINAMTDQLKENLKKMETDHMKIITTVKNGDDNQQDQNEIVEEMIDAGCDVLCVNLVDRTAPSRIIRMAKQEDIPVLFFNREPVREDLMQWEKLYYIGCDAEQSGIMPDEAKAGGVRVMATGRSDFPNQVNNVLCFPGLFKGALSVRARDINDQMKLAAAYAIADLITDDDRSEENIIPGAFDPRVAQAVADAVAQAARDTGVARL